MPNNELVGRDLADYGFATLRDIMFDAVVELWRERKASGVTTKQVADRIERSVRWVEDHLAAPGNWTLRTAGELIKGLEGEAEVVVRSVIPFTPQPCYGCGKVHYGRTRRCRLVRPRPPTSGIEQPSIAVIEQAERHTHDY